MTAMRQHCWFGSMGFCGNEGEQQGCEAWVAKQVYDAWGKQGIGSTKRPNGSSTPRNTQSDNDQHHRTAAEEPPSKTGNHRRSGACVGYRKMGHAPSTSRESGKQRRNGGQSGRPRDGRGSARRSATWVTEQVEHPWRCNPSTVYRIGRSPAR